METVLMILCWIGFALGMCVVPIVFRDDYRQLVWNRLRYGTWQVGGERRNRTQTTTTTSTQTHLDKQALAALCEARVRQALLPYTRAVQSQDVLCTATTGTSTQLEDPTVANVNQSSPQSIIRQNTRDDASRPKQHYETAVSDTSSTSDDDDKASSDDDDDDDVETAMSPPPLDLGEEIGQINVPMAGSMVKSNDNDNVPCRCVSNQCTICLSPFSANSEHHPHISWSSNPQCVHVFHSACITHWLSEAGRRHVQRRLRRHQEEPPKDILLDFPMQCPCCRQAFIRPTKHKEDVGLPDGSPQNENEAPQQPPNPTMIATERDNLSLPLAGLTMQRNDTATVGRQTVEGHDDEPMVATINHV